jgi:hypothetical protein
MQMTPRNLTGREKKSAPPPPPIINQSAFNGSEFECYLFSASAAIKQSCFGIFEFSVSNILQ